MKKLSVCALLFFSTMIHAAAPQWKMIPAKSSITFTATQNGAPAEGKFSVFTSDVAFDPQRLTESHVQIAVDMGSVTTSYAEIGDTLKAAEWFNVAVFPKAIFKANQFKKTGDKTYEAQGSLTIRDKTIPVTLQFTLEDYSATTALAKGHTQLKRTAFGVGQGEYAKTDDIKDDVSVDFVLAAQK